MNGGWGGAKDIKGGPLINFLSYFQWGLDQNSANKGGTSTMSVKREKHHFTLKYITLL